YAESRSIVAFLIDKYGPEKMNDLLKAFPRLATIERALEEVYGFDTEGLQTAWRDSVGLPTHVPVAEIAPEPIPIIPELGLPQQQATPDAKSTPTPSPTATAAAVPTQTPAPKPSGGSGCNRASTDSSGLDGGLVIALMLGSIIIGRKLV
ncbi:MAG: peptidase MA family metallohydrolase, partial [Chloroflexi bacterium]|nr:peptidase MA family metallohydrolase [Chloroflexota bacterium]